MKLRVGRFQFTVNDCVSCERYECADYFGVVFRVNGDKYDVVCNKYFGDRLIWNKKTGEWHDIPFRTESSFGKLPEEIIVEVVEDTSYPRL